MEDFSIIQTNDLNEYPLDLSEEVTENYKVVDNVLVKFEYVCSIPNMDSESRKNRIGQLHSIALANGKIVIAKIDDKIVGVASLKAEKFSNNRMQLYTLHVDRCYRKKGIGKALLNKVIELAKASNADGLYISAAPKVNTVDFYKKCGAKLTLNIEPALFNEEPDDIHMEIMWNQ